MACPAFFHARRDGDAGHERILLDELGRPGIGIDDHRDAEDADGGEDDEQNLCHMGLSAKLKRWRCFRPLAIDQATNGERDGGEIQLHIGPSQESGTPPPITLKVLSSGAMVTPSEM